MTRKILMALFLVALAAAPGFGEDAAKLLNHGVELFEKGDYESAGKAFTEADVALPDNRTIAFARACVYASQGDMDKAIEEFQEASLSRNPKVAVESRYNLGCIAGEKARTLFGSNPEEAAPEVRQEGMDLLLRAVKHYRDCIKLDPDHERARHNLELTRLWIKHMEAVWRERDRQKAREEMNLLQFLQMIEQRQAAVRNLTRDLAKQEDSPRRRQALKETEEEQKALVEEVDPYLKDKIRQTLQPAPQQPGAPGAPGGQAPGGTQGGMAPDKREEALKLLLGWADEARDAMAQSGDFIIGAPEESLPYQVNALDALDRIFGAVAPFQTVLQKALDVQQQVVNRTIPLVESPDDQEETDYEDMAWPQERVQGWSAVLPYKAQEAMKQIEPQEEALLKQAQAQGADPEKTKAELEKLKAALQKTIELSPRIQSLTGEAVKRLREEDAPGALPKEEEALKLLKEIADSLPKKDQQNQQGDQKKDQQQEQKQNPQQQQQQKQPQEKRQGTLSKEEAEALLQKAKEREREHKEMEEDLQRALAKPGKVEKDW
jgi:tetratricopeptide (TPR) repeat protein